MVTRAFRATRLRERIARGPAIDAAPFTTLTERQVLEVREKYLIWVNTWVLPDLDSLVPELRSRQSKES